MAKHLETHFARSQNKDNGATVFAYPVKKILKDMELLILIIMGNIISIEEKPQIT